MVENSDSFDDDNKVVYLNNAGQARLDIHTQQVGINAIQYPLEVQADQDQKQIRKLFARLISAEETDIAIMASTAFSISLAAVNVQKNFSGKKGRIIVLQDQMCSAIYAWQQLCEISDGNISLDIIPYPSGKKGWTEVVVRRLERDKDVLLACLPPLHWSDGSLLDLNLIGDICYKKGIMLIVDATQAVGIMPCDVNQIRPTMLACSVHKWLRGPSGISLVYLSKDIHDLWQPLDQHSRGRDFPAGKAWDAPKNDMGPNGYPETFFRDARKFDSGGKPNPFLLPMLRASLEQIVEIDVLAAQEQLKLLVTPLLEWARLHGYVISPGPHANHIIGIRPKSISTEQMLDICEKIQQRGIWIAVRCGAFRVSPYLDNTDDDILCLIEALSEFCP